MICRTCCDSGAVLVRPVPASATLADCDLCPECVLCAELEWQARRAGFVLAMEGNVMRLEHAPGETAGTVTMGAVRVNGKIKLEVVAYAAVLRAVPWFRGGVGVTALRGGNGCLMLDRFGPYRLLARATNRLDKMPPVQLRVPALPEMADEEHRAEPVAFRTYSDALELRLPAWARRPDAPVAPFGPIGGAGRGAGAAR